jgi:lysophospholipase L1-like esterase
MKNRKIQHSVLIGALTVVLLMAAPAAWAQYWTSFDTDTRYMALGDSLSAGYGAKPATQGFVFRLYQSGVVDKLNNLLFCAAAVPSATSNDVLRFQVPQVQLFFADTGEPYRKVVTLTVGGNDAFSVLNPDGTVDLDAIPGVLTAYGQNLSAILSVLVGTPGNIRVYVGNLYDPKLPIPGAEQIVAAMNQVTAQVVGAFHGKVVLVDLYSAFEGRSGLLLIERHGAAPDEVHPTNAGYGVMADAFADAMGNRKGGGR